MTDSRKTLGEICGKLGLEAADSLAKPTWNGVELKEVYPWGTLRKVTPAVNRSTAEELSDQERAEIRARAWQYLEIFDYKSFYK